MDAVLLSRSKTVLPDGAIVEIVLWQVPEPVAGSMHRYKYRLFYGRDGRRIVGFDNERGKGDHCHLDGEEQPYAFSTVAALLEDFQAEIAKRRP
ncbi:toxin-antitoxin system TumE family protein [Shinella zoogloeoides]